MSTVELAKHVSKRHDNVLRDARAALDELGMSHLKFEGTYRDAQGKERSCLYLRRHEVETAKRTGKEHKHVLTLVDDQLDRQGIDRLQYQRMYPDRYGRPQRCYALHEAETMILITGWSVPLRAAIDDMLDRLGIDRSRFGLMYPDTYGRPQRCHALPEREPARAAAI